MQFRFVPQLKLGTTPIGDIVFDTCSRHEKELSELIPLVALPKKGGRSQADKIREGTKEFGAIRKWRSGVESAIHALVAGNGMKVCRDKGVTGYDRYVATAILGRNLHVLGNILLEKEREKRRKSKDPLELISTFST